jgi:hypothetical protein
MIVRNFALPLVALALSTAPLAAQAPVPVPLTPADSTKLMQVGHRVIGWMMNGQADSVATALSKDFIEASGGLAGIAERVGKLPEQVGQPTGIAVEKMTRREGKPQFWHEAILSGYPEEPIVFRLVFGADGKISGIGMGPKSSAKWDQ